MDDRSYTEYEFRGFVVAAHMLEGLRAYVDTGRPVGDFLTAVLENNLNLAVGYADRTNMANLPAFVGYLHNEAPSQCHGSKEKVTAWIEAGGLRGIAAKADGEISAPPDPEGYGER